MAGASGRVPDSLFAVRYSSRSSAKLDHGRSGPAAASHRVEQGLSMCKLVVMRLPHHHDGHGARPEQARAKRGAGTGLARSMGIQLTHKFASLHPSPAAQLCRPPFQVTKCISRQTRT